MSDDSPRDPGERPSGYAVPTPPPAAAPPYGSVPVYGSPPPYGSAPQYPAPQYPAGQYPPAQYPAPYGAAAPYPYAPQVKTNALAIVSLIASLVGIIGILPFIGSVTGVITGHLSLRQLRTSGEKGHGMALAGTIVGWVGVGLSILFGIFIILAIVAAAQSSAGRYGA